MGYDGTLKFDTTIDASGVNKGAKEVGNTVGESSKKVGNSLDELIKKLNQEVKDGTRSAKSAAATLAQEYRKAGDDTQTAMKKAWEQIERSSKSGSGKVDDDLDDIEKHGKSSALKLKEHFSSAFQKIGSIAKAGLKVATAAIAAVGAGLVAAGGYAVKVGSDFEAGMSKVAAISGATGDELDALTEKAKEMGAKTKFSATESAAAFEYMAMAGWKTGDMLDGIEGIMNLAAASGEDLANVSDIVTDALTAFGLQASDSAHFADVLAKASSSSNTNVGLMGATFKYVAPIAGAMKYSIEDTAVAIGLMANAGIKGEQAGTALRSTLSRLVDPPKDAAEALDDLGISAVNADGTMKPLSEVMVDLREKFKGLDDSQKASYASSIAGTEAMSGFLAIVTASDEDFNNLTESINNADGAAQSMADTMQDNLQGQVTILQSALEGLGIEVYESVQEPLKELAKQGTGYVDQLTQAFKSGGLSGLVEELGSVLSDVTVKVAEAAPQLIDTAVNTIQAFISGIQNNMPQITQAAVEIGSSLLNGILTVLPLLLTTGGKLLLGLAQGVVEEAPSLIVQAVDVLQMLIDGLVANIPLLVDVAAQLVSELAFGIGTALPQLIPAAIDGILTLAESLIDNIDLLIDAALALIQGLADGLIAALPVFLEKAPVIITKLIDAIVENLPKLIEAAYMLIIQLAEGIVQNLPLLYKAAYQIIGALVAAIPKYLRNIIEVGKNVASALWDAIAGTNWLQLAGDIIDGVVGGLLTGLTGNESTWEDIKQWFADGWNGICTFFTETIPAFFSQLWTDIKQAFSNGWNAIVTFFTESIPAWIDSVIEWFSTLPERAGEKIGELLGCIYNFATSAWEWVTNDLPLIIQGVVDWFAGLPGRIWEWLTTAISNIIAWGTETYNNATQAASNAIQAIVDWFAGLPGKVWTWLNETINKIKSWGTDMVSKGKQAASDLVKAVKDTIAELPGKVLSIGEDIVRGLWNGITGMADWLAGKVSGFVDGIISGFKKSAQIKSPSRRMKREVGVYFPAGISEGFDEGMPQLLKTVERDTASAVARMQSVVNAESAKISGIVAANATYQAAKSSPVIQNNITPTPVQVQTHTTLITPKGKVLAEETTPYADQKMGKDIKLKERGAK